MRWLRGCGFMPLWIKRRPLREMLTTGLAALRGGHHDYDDLHTIAVGFACTRLLLFRLPLARQVGAQAQLKNRQSITRACVCSA